MSAEYHPTVSQYNLIDMILDCDTTGLEIMAGQRTVSGLIGELTGQHFVMPVMLTDYVRSY